MATVRELMATEPVTVEPEETLRVAADLLTASGVSGAPVTRNGHVVGVVTLSDIVEFEADDPGVPVHRPEMLDEAEEDVDEPGLPEEQDPYSRWFVEMWDSVVDVSTRFETDAPEWNTLDQHTVAEVMSNVVHSVRPDADVREAAALMQERSIHRLLVMEDEQLVGILSAWDIVRGVANGKVGGRSAEKAA